MLTELSIRDFAIIDKVSITFTEGLTVLTGETGAGKSIIIDALQLLAGGRGSVEFVRHGSKKAEIEGLFIIEDTLHPIYPVSHQFGVDIQDGQVVLERIITANGKSICRVNGKLVTLAILREFGKTLIDIHSQHETQSLMDPEMHIDLLDLYDEKISEVKKDYSQLYNKLTEMKKRYKHLNENEQENAHRLDLLQFQHNEIEQARLSPDEDKILEEEREKLANYERIYTSLHNSYNALYGEQRGIDWLNIAQQSLQEGSNYDKFIFEKAEEMTNYFYMIEEIASQIRNYTDTLEFNPQRLNEIEARLDEISRLKKKYGDSVNNILEYAATIEEEIEQLKNKDTHLNEMATTIKEIEKDAFLEAKQLHDCRKNAAARLVSEIHNELKGLYLEKTTFAIQFQPDSTDVDHYLLTNKSINLHKQGLDTVRFMISTNPGEPLKELSKVASGGELSRIMLVLKKIFAKHQGVTSVIFDEVDTGVSGRVAQAIAEKIYQISNQSQVLCITHLPQVAAMADTHKFIEKREKKERITTSVNELTREEQIEELSRMITGTKLTETAKEHAKELLDLALQFKTI